THEKAPDAAARWPCARRFLIGCLLGWPGSACFASGVSCTRPPAHEAYRPARRASGYTAYPCSRHSTARSAPLPAEHRRVRQRIQTVADAPCRGLWPASFRVPPSVILQSLRQFVQSLCTVALDGAVGHSHKAADLAVCHSRVTVQN